MKIFNKIVVGKKVKEYLYVSNPSILVEIGLCYHTELGDMSCPISKVTDRPEP